MIQPFDGHAISPETTAFLGQTHRLLIGGEWVAAADGAVIDVTDPATGASIARVPSLSRAEVGRAVAAARRAGEDTLVYGVLSERERGAAAAAEADAEEYLEEALQGAFAT